MKFAKALVLGALLTAGAALAEDAAPTDPQAIAREALMKVNGMNMGILGDMAGGKAAYDAAAAEAAKAALVASLAAIETTFAEQGAADPASTAKAEIWTGWDDFLAKSKTAIDAANALDVSSAESIGAGMGAIGGACKDCHMTYRMN